MSRIHRWHPEELVDRYLTAKAFVVRSGYAAEIDWQDQRRLEDTTESTFLLETAWVILSSGMREAVIRQRFPLVSEAFLNWSSARAILKRRRTCRRKALAAFGHVPKIDAILASASLVMESGIEQIKRRVVSLGVEALQAFPFIGPVTAWHLAKNLGVDVAKPDRHLCRISEAAGFASPLDLCNVISDHVGDRLAVVDLVLWRFATLELNYRAFFDARRKEDDGLKPQLNIREVPARGGQCKPRMCA